MPVFLYVSAAPAQAAAQPALAFTHGAGARRTIVADVEWTFPLEFVEVVWGDGQKTDRQIISATDLPAFGRRHFQIPFDATGKKWVRFAAWDTAGNGAMCSPSSSRAPRRRLRRGKKGMGFPSEGV